MTVPSAAQLWDSCRVKSRVLERANSQQPLTLLLPGKGKPLLRLRGWYKRKELQFGWNVIAEGSLFSVTSQKALCWEQSSLPNPSRCDLWPTQQKCLTSVFFSPEPSGAEAPQGGLSVHHILRDYIVRGQPKSGNTKLHGWGTTSHTPWGHNPFVLFWMWAFQFLKGQVMLLLFVYYKISLPWKQGNPNSSLFRWA